MTWKVCALLILQCICGIKGGTSQDHSPYCAGLSKITNLCEEVFVFLMCPKTCETEHTSKLSCGVRKFGDVGSFPEKNRKKRFDSQFNDEGGENIHSRVRRIVGGKPTVPGAYPWHVALHFKGKQICAGAILSPDWVVTAAHCFDADTTSYKESDWLVVAGEHSLFGSEQTEKVLHVKKIIIHERNYKYWKIGYRNVPDDYDVALLKLKTSFVFNDYISPVCLPGLNKRFTHEDQCKIMGWGSAYKNGNKQDTLHEATTKLVPRDICNLPMSYNGSVHDRAICAGFKDGQADACEYDSGGSLACKKGDHWYSVGLISYKYQCGTPKLYGVYTNLPLMKSWIVDTLLSYDDQTNSLIPIQERINKLNPYVYRNSRKKPKRLF